MTLLIAGIVLWALVHLFHRLAPGLRDRLIARFGAMAVKIGVAILSFAALGLIVIGFKTTPFVPVYEPPFWGVYVNNLLMFGAVMLFGIGSVQGRLRSLLRHPMLTGVIVWALAHLLVNGDQASLVLFVAMLAWAGAEITLINARSGPWQRPEPGPASGDIRLALFSIAAFTVIAYLHGLIGPSPFPG